MKKKILFSGILTTLLISGGAYYQTNNTTIQNQSYDSVIYVPSDRFPESAQHILDAQKAGKSKICTIDRKDIVEHRKESLRGIKTKVGYDRDEVPFAMCSEGGEGADVRLIHSEDNRGSGSWISHQVSDLPDGARVLIKVK
ncbi:NucA/NucB deoxyribonuclease domain-containing protein [Bacillus xiapuensis]|uniref:NucA/NucB deoxyribonuclease domain-containing protein n=1 Tax=Bacillus xiapuensis TaxID=2014075 RepID=A0ABU6N7Y5_9BACI|nr:NucA/NucB deoxyribonuclease domain-containing protein [Bacillus xiapuensis]